MNRILFGIALLCGTCATAQIQIDKPIELTGTGADGRLTGIKSVIDDEDATSKFYVDSLVTNGGGGGCTELEMAEAGPNISVINGSPALLQGRTPVMSTGLWTVHFGSGGAFDDNTDPQASFTGNENTTYTLKWTLSQTGCPTISDFVDVTFSIAHYPNGNTAYWTEKDNGFRPVRIANSQVVFTYDSNNKQYVSGNLILLPTIPRIGVSQPETVSSTAFFGFSGGSASNTNFQWDSQTTLSGNVYDVGQVFVSPVSPAINYCRALYSDFVGNCNSTVSSIRYDNTKFAYNTTPNGTGPYAVWTGGDLTPVNNTGAFGNRRYSQQAMVGGDFKSYCVATYGNGWRMPTDIEVGRPNNLNDNNVPPLNTGYLGTTNIQMWSTTIACQSGGGTCYNEYRQTWRLNNSQHTWPWSSGQAQVDNTNNSVRCIYTGGN